MELQQNCFCDNKRDALTYSIKLKLGNAVHEFSIEGEAGRGGSAICYNATRKIAGEKQPARGTLKEFYPLDSDNDGSLAYNLVRRGADEGDLAYQLVAKPSGYENFITARDEFYKAYLKVADLVNNSPSADNYIPKFEIYRGITDKDNEENYTYYIWSQGNTSVISFSEYLDRIQDDVKSRTNLEKHLETILETALQLVQCISSLHVKGLLHLDIKPGNFGIKTNPGEYLPQISMFDINTIYSVENPLARTAGTVGFRAPELAKGLRDYIGLKTDIYSIGATLFNALIYSDGCRQIYTDDNFDELDSILTHSEIIEFSDANSNSKLHDILVTILTRCLERRRSKPVKNNYSSVTELIADLKKALDIVRLPKGHRAISEPHQIVQTTLVDKEEFWDKQIPTGAAGAIQWLLYSKPLYNYAENGKVNVLVLGAGTYSRKFIDLALEISQVSNCYLNIHVLTMDVEANKKRFLSRREFKNYFCIDGAQPAKEDYGSVFFHSTGDGRKFNTNPAGNREIFSVLPGDVKFSYAFISLGDDKLNRFIAQNISECRNFFADSHLINYIRYKGKKAPADDGPDLNAVLVSDILTNHPEYKLLRKMAFNAHLLWNSSLSNLARAKGEFSNPYYFSSSLANALSLSYKLNSIGVDLDPADPSKTAVEVMKKLSRDTQDGIDRLNELTMYEHRRWIVNLIANSWEQPDSFDCLVNDTKDKRNKKHPCLVPSGKQWTLHSKKWDSSIHPELWDDENADLSELDELDRMSITLHRHFKKIAANVSSDNFRNDIEQMRLGLAGNDSALNIFNAYCIALNEILRGDCVRSRGTYNSYQYYLGRLKKALGEKSPLKSRLDIIEKNIYPVLESIRYTDWKSKDRTLIEDLPFILTYHASIRLFIPFTFEQRGEWNTNGLFRNVASSLLLNPSRVTYAVDADGIENSIDRISEAVTYAVNTMDSHGLQTKICIALVSDINAGGTPVEIKNRLMELSDRITDVDSIYYGNGESAFKALQKYLDSNKKSPRAFTAVERNLTNMSGRIDAYEGIPKYSFDSVTMQFLTDGECEYFNYIPQNLRPNLTIEDMFRAKGKICTYNEPEMMGDYGFFRNLYLENKSLWKSLCSALGNYAKKNDLIISCPVADPLTAEYETPETLFLPAFARSGTEEILKKLSEPEIGVIRDNFTVEDYTSQSIKVTLSAEKKFSKLIGRVFANPYHLIDGSQINTVPTSNGFFKILFNDLWVNRLMISNLPQDGEKLLERIAQKGYLVDYCKNSDTIQFFYSSPQIKSLMTKGGQIFELYVYYSALATGYFDEIRTGLKILWNDKKLSNELDIVLVKGFKTQIVECKAGTELQQEFYNKLLAVGTNFGLNNQCLLVIDPDESKIKNARLNEMQNSRGREYRIETILDAESIHTIGNQLQARMEKYR